MTRKRWLELYDEFGEIESREQFEDLLRWLLKLLIELKPEDMP